MRDTIKILASYDDETLAKAMQEVKASDEKKAEVMKQIHDYRYIKREIAKMFGK